MGLEASGASTNPAAALTDSILSELGSAIRAQPLLGKATTLHVGPALRRIPRPSSLGGAGTILLSDEKGDVGDPELVDPAHGDLHLSPGSPAIYAGLAGPLLPGESQTDLEGQPRIEDGNGDGIGQRDIGAIEAPALVPTVTSKSTPPAAISQRAERRETASRPSSAPRIHRERGRQSPADGQRSPSRVSPCLPSLHGSHARNTDRPDPPG